ncbi:outer membrane beta-barrel protein [uncultured Flavobacterium sp.]|uniref:outer membrane beta-barrel protein n=1 Tax=uncultured Flavobacterium sp. TaxID=165435 RepID=UPI0030C82377
MKKNVLIIIVFCLQFNAYSQEKFSVFTGVNYNFLTEGHYEGLLSENSVSLHLGVAYNFRLNEKISFRPKLVFSQQGDRVKTEQTIPFNLTQFDYKLSYINVPLEFKFWNKIYLITGPQVGYLINTEKLSNDLGEVDSNIDIGLNVGGGFEFNNYFIELSTFKGFSKIFEYEDIYNDKHSLTNTLFRLSVGYNF